MLLSKRLICAELTALSVMFCNNISTNGPFHFSTWKIDTFLLLLANVFRVLMKEPLADKIRK